MTLMNTAFGTAKVKFETWHFLLQKETEKKKLIKDRDPAFHDTELKITFEKR